MKKILILIACLLALGASPVSAQTGGPGVIVVSTAFNKAVITREDGKSEVLTFQSGGSLEKALTASSQWYQKMISKLYQEGYAIKSSFSEGGGRATLVFVKGQ